MVRRQKFLGDVFKARWIRVKFVHPVRLRQCVVSLHGGKIVLSAWAKQRRAADEEDDKAGNSRRPTQRWRSRQDYNDAHDNQDETGGLPLPARAPDPDGARYNVRN